MISGVFEVIDKTPELPFFIAALIYMRKVPAAEYTHTFSVAFLFIATVVIVGSALKLVFRTKRPKELTKFILFKYGFPSLHATVSIGAVAFIYFINPLMAAILAPVGLLFMVSRVELHYHTGGDVEGGAVLGLIFGVIFGRYVLWLKFAPHTEFVFAILFFITPLVFSIFRLKHKV